MDNEKLNTELYQKMFAEQEKYRDWLLTQPPEEILNHTYEYTVREDILMSAEMNDFTDEQCAALLKSPNALSDIFSEFEKRETDHMNTVLDCIECRANAVLREEFKERQALLNTPVYKYPASYAREHDELDVYRASHKANIACQDAIDEAISSHYSENSLHTGGVKEVADRFGFDRVLYVLANTVREKDWDGRIDRRNKEWAQTIPIFEDDNSFGDNRNREFVVSRSHTGLVDLFVKEARREYLLTQPLTKEEIHMEAAKILGKLQSPRETNSPNGTHFIAEVSPDFLARAKDKDRDKLMKLLPFPSLALSSLNDRKGIFAIISKDENRNQPLQKRKPSVRDKLQNTEVKPKTPIDNKSKDKER